jgi:methionyl-tRNA formyltransferase
MSKIVLLTTDELLSRVVAHALLQRFGDVSVLIVQKRALLSSLRYRIRHLGVKRAAGQLLLFRAYGTFASRFAARRRRAILAEHRLDNSPLPRSIVRRVASVNTEEMIRLLQELGPDVIVVFHTPIIPARVLAKVGVPFINLHGGITPAYRGNHATYWAMVNRDPDNCGATVHLVNKGVDTGDIIYQMKARPAPEDNLFTYQYFQTANGIPLLLRAVDDVLKRTLSTYRRDAEPSVLWRTPTLFEYLRNGWRTGVW